MGWGESKPTKRIYVTARQEAALRRLVDRATNSFVSPTIDDDDLNSLVALLTKLDAKEAK